MRRCEHRMRATCSCGLPHANEVKFGGTNPKGRRQGVKVANETVSTFNAGASLLGYLYQVRVALL